MSNCTRQKKKDKTPYQRWLDWGAGIKRRDGQVGYKEVHMTKLKEIAENKFTFTHESKLPNSFNSLYTLTRELRSLPESAQQVIVGEIVETYPIDYPIVQSDRTIS